MNDNVIKVTPDEMRILSSTKSSIDWMKKNNQDGRHSEQIDRESNLIRSFFDKILGKPTSD